MHSLVRDDQNLLVLSHNEEFHAHVMRGLVWSGVLGLGAQSDTPKLKIAV